MRGILTFIYCKLLSKMNKSYILKVFKKNKIFYVKNNFKK
jgi:hypothetical protein